MLLLIAAAFAGMTGPTATQSATAPAEASKGAAVPKRVCRQPRAMVAREPRAAARPRRLDELPPGNLEFAVQREVDGCIEATIIRRDVGGDEP